MVQKQTEMINSISSLQGTLEGIVGIEEGINLTGVGAMEEESSGLGEANISVAGKIGQWERLQPHPLPGGLGMAIGVQNTSVNYLSRFLPNLSDVMHPIYDLACPTSVWKWDAVHEDDFAKMKYFKTLTIQCDASGQGLGAALLQNGHH